VVIVMSLTSAVVTGTTWLFMPISGAGVDLTDLHNIIKKVSIVTVLGAILFLMVRFEITTIHSVQEGTVAVRTSWGRPKYSRYGSRKGRLVTLQAGRHLMIRGLHGLVVVSLREEHISLPAQEVTFKGRTLQMYPLDINWRIEWEDTLEGDKILLNRVWFVADNNVHDLAIGTFETKLHVLLKKALSMHLEVADASDDGFPVFKLEMLASFAKRVIDESEAQLVAGRTMKFILPKLTMLSVPPMSWTPGQQRVDAARIEAEARIEAARVLSHQPWLHAVDAANGTD
jgi:hypothetical protein